MKLFGNMSTMEKIVWSVILLVIAFGLFTSTPAQAPPDPLTPAVIGQDVGDDGLSLKLRIVGGENTDYNLYPYHVQLVNTQSVRNERGYFPAGMYWCAGALLTPVWVITAQHCEGIPEPLNTVGQGVSVNGASKGRLMQGKFQSVCEKVTRSDYNETTKDNDIMLLRLCEPVPNAQVIHLPTKELTDLLERLHEPDGVQGKTGRKMTIIGRGSQSEAGWFTDELQKATVPLVNRTVCKRAMSPYRVTENMICAGYVEGGIDACQGDSGGEMVWVWNNPYSGEKIHFLIGITSYGVGCARADRFGVYTRVGEYTEWIRSIIYEVPEDSKNTARSVMSSLMAQEMIRIAQAESLPDTLSDATAITGSLSSPESDINLRGLSVDPDVELWDIELNCPEPIRYEIQNISKIYDGDTLTATVYRDEVFDAGFGINVTSTISFSESFRWYGIDTPEVTGESKPAGLVSKAWVEQKILGSKGAYLLTCGERGKFGRPLAMFYRLNDFTSLNGQLVQKNLANEYYGGTR